MNKVLLNGRLTKDVETSYNKQTSIVRGTLAVSTSQKDVTSFVNIVAFNKIGEILEKYTKKGTLIGVVGELRQGSYKNQKGEWVNYSQVVVEKIDLLEPKSKSNNKDGFVKIPENIDLPFNE